MPEYYTDGKFPVNLPEETLLQEIGNRIVKGEDQKLFRFLRSYMTQYSNLLQSVDLYKDGIGKVEWIQHMGDELTIINSAKVSYGNEDFEMTPRNLRLMDRMLKHKHTSVFEHNFITFRFIVPIFVRSQHHRHRTWSYNEISRRYTAKDLKFYFPKEMRAQAVKNKQGSRRWFNPIGEYALSRMNATDAVGWHTRASLKVFETLLKSGVAREMARIVLPQNQYTEYWGTVNLNNLFKFLVLRMDPHSQWEMQQVAHACFLIGKSLFPSPFEFFEKFLIEEDIPYPHITELEDWTHCTDFKLTYRGEVYDRKNLIFEGKNDE